MQAAACKLCLRIPQEKFEVFYEQLGSSVHVVYSSRSSEDVTEQYTDIETRLATLTTKHERLLALLDQRIRWRILSRSRTRWPTVNTRSTR